MPSAQPGSTMSHSKFVSIVTMTLPQVAFAIQLAAAEGWNPGLHDAASFHAGDPDGFLMAELEGEPVGCISAVSYPGGYGFIGLYIVMAEYRGQGIGGALWKQAMQRLAGHNIGLDGVVAMQSAYARSGFKLAYRNIRYAGSDLPPPAESTDGTVLASPEAVPWNEILVYDRRFFPADREAFLKAWLTQPGVSARVALRQGQVSGLAVMRPCLQGCKVGPLFAESPQTAQLLLLSLAQMAPSEEPVILDVPEVNPSAVRLAEDLGMERVFETARMYTGSSPAVSLSETFGVTTFELG